MRFTVTVSGALEAEGNANNLVMQGFKAFI
jgi:hypothetical protein